MSYVTTARLRGILIPDGGADPATDDLATPATMTDPELQIAIDDACAYIDAALAISYVVPVSPTPALLTKLAGDIAAYYATLTFRKTKDLEERDPAQLRFNQAQNLLEQIGTGTLLLPGATQTDGTTTADVINPYEGDLFRPSQFDLRDAPRRRDWY